MSFWQEAGLIAAWLVVVVAGQQIIARGVEKGMLSRFQARKTVHILVGLSVIPLVDFVSRRSLAVIPVAMIFAGNAVTHLTVLKAESPKRAQWFALVAVVLPTLLLVWFWRTEREAIVLSVLAMTFGDAAAAIFGKAFGKRRIKPACKSIEGAIANFLVSLGVLFGAAWFFFGVAPGSWPMIAVSVAALNAALEAVLPGAWDNPVCVLTSFMILTQLL